MLHELLLSLVGYSGNVIVETREGFVLAPDFPHLHPSERELINKICRLGYYFLQIDSYVQKHSQFSPVEGFYVRAMCEGINVILDSYRGCVLKAEQQVLADTSTSLSHLLHILYEYEIIFPELYKIINTIQERDMHGLAIADFLYKSSFTGIPEVQACINSLLTHCNKVFVDQATAWMVHGLLLDPHKEFLITENPKTASTSDATNSTVKSVTNSTSSTSSSSLNSISTPTSALAPNAATNTPTTDNQFSLHYEMIPGYIPFRVSEKILFIGWAVRVLQQQKKNKDKDKDNKDWKNVTSSSVPTSNLFLQRATSKKFTRTKSRSLSMRALPTAEQQEITQSLRSLRDLPALRTLDLEVVVHDIRTRVAKHLWSLVVEGAGLMDHLHAMRDYYLLSKGEFHQCFVDESRNLMALPPNQNAEHDLNVAFQQSAIRSTAHLDEFFENFQGWKGIYLEYKIEWPLDLLFPPSIMDKYNTLFRFLLTVKRVQSELQRVWLPQMSGKRQSVNERARLMPVLLLRRKMAFLIDNLQYYLMVNVLDKQYTLLCRRLSETKDFEAIRKFHEEYLDSLISQSFLHVKDVSKFLERVSLAEKRNEKKDDCFNIFQLCLELCAAINRSETETIDFLKINDLKRDFERQAGLLFKILSGVKSHHESPHLAQLLLFLDYNKYFTDVNSKLSGQELY